MAIDWTRVRSEFPALENWTFLNTATFGQMPRRATEAATRHFADRDRFACANFLEWFDDADRIRELASRLIHATAADIAFIPNASAALSLLLGGICWKAGDQIVTLQHEFPNHYYYASYLGARGVEFIETPYEHFYDRITARTRLVALSTVNYVTGFRAPLSRIAPFLRERGILLYVDGTQSVGALEFDAGAIQPDLFAVHGYKWLLSPNGAGFMYVHPELRKILPPNVIGWRSHHDWRNHDYLHHGTPEFKSEAEKYEGGMLPFTVVYAMGAVIQMMLELGPAAIERRVMDVAEQARCLLRKAGARLLSDENPHYDSPVIAARFDNRDASAIAGELENRRVLVAARHGNLRVSPHFYNDETDLEKFERELAEVLRL